VDIPERFQKPIVDLIDEVNVITDLLGPALEATIGLIYIQHVDRAGAKEKFRAVRTSRHDVFRHKIALVSTIYNSDLDFKDIYQLIHFIERLEDMGHNTERCADILRSMIAR